jgi:hypothetical protein
MSKQSQKTQKRSIASAGTGSVGHLRQARDLSQGAAVGALNGAAARRAARALVGAAGVARALDGPRAAWGAVVTLVGAAAVARALDGPRAAVGAVVTLIGAAGAVRVLRRAAAAQGAMVTLVGAARAARALDGHRAAVGAVVTFVGATGALETLDGAAAAGTGTIPGSRAITLVGVAAVGAAHRLVGAAAGAGVVLFVLFQFRW